MKKQIKDVHKLSIQMQNDLTKFIYREINNSESSIISHIIQYTSSLPEPTSSYAVNVSEAIAKAYKRQGFLSGEFSTGWINDKDILDNFKGMVDQLPFNALQNVKSLNKELVRLTADGYTTQSEAVRLMKLNVKNDFVFKSKDGRQWRFDTIVKRMIRDQCKNATRETSKTIANELGTDVFQVSTHAGARPKCAKDQGKLFSDAGGVFEDLNGDEHKVLPWAESSRGDADGLFGYNCRHIEYPLVAGFSVPSKTDPMKKLSNELNRNEVEMQSNKL